MRTARGCDCAADSGLGQGGGELLPLLLDVTDELQVQQAVEAVRSACEQRGWRLYAVVHNAGCGEYGPLELVSVERLRRQYEVNVVAPHRLTLCFLPLLRRSAELAQAASSLPPRLLFVTSVTARLTVAGRAAYGSSKCALLSLSNGWRQELRAFGIAVVEVCPGELRSDFHATSRSNYGQLLRECSEAALQPAGAQPPACPPPLPLSVLNHYDRCYTASSRRWRVLGDASMSSDAIEAALRTAAPPARIDCGDDAAASSVLRLLPTRCIDWLLGRLVRTADEDGRRGAGRGGRAPPANSGRDSGGGAADAGSSGQRRGGAGCSIDRICVFECQTAARRLSGRCLAE